MDGDKIVISDIEGIHPMELLEVIKNISKANDYGMRVSLENTPVEE